MRIPNILLKKIFYIPAGAVLVFVIVIAFVTGGGDFDFDTERIEREDLVHIVSETGIVEAAQDIELSFARTGRVGSLLVKEGDVVSRGDLLASLELGALVAELRQAEADLAIKRAEAQNQTIAASSITQKYNTLVRNAYEKLLSEGLIAEPSGESYTQTPPVITGRYSGPEGVYKVKIERGVTVHDFNLYTFGIQQTGPVKISTTAPTPLGTHGLYIDFLDDLSEYPETIWFIDIPNTKASVYVSNLSAYESALRDRERAIEDAEADLRDGASGVSIAEAEVAQAEARVVTAQAALNDARIVAPVDGTVTGVSVEVGETITAGVGAVSLISNEHKITVNIPEEDISFVDVGDMAKVRFDAYDDELFEATVVFVSPRAETIEGVAVFEATLQFVDNDERIRVGLSADVDIIAESRTEVLSVPSRAIISENSNRFVRVVTSGDTYKRVPVTVGLRSSNGRVEVQSGLEEGDRVITFVGDDVLQELTDETNGTF